MKIEIGDCGKEKIILYYQKIAEKQYTSRILYQDKRTSNFIQIQTTPVESSYEYSSVIHSYRQMICELRKYKKATINLLDQIISKYNDINQLKLF